MKNNKKTQDTSKNISTEKLEPHSENTSKIKEIGGPKGLEPTRYGDWEKKGRCIDF